MTGRGLKFPGYRVSVLFAASDFSRFVPTVAVCPGRDGAVLALKALYLPV